MTDEFEIKDSGERKEFGSGMVRDTAEGKINWLSVRVGPMLRRWADHCTKGRIKYPDPKPGVPNWTLAEGEEEYERFRESAARHFEAWLAGERDEDHAAGVFFNINGAEYVRDKMMAPAREWAAGVQAVSGIDFSIPFTTDESVPKGKMFLIDADAFKMWDETGWMNERNCAGLRTALPGEDEYRSSLRPTPDEDLDLIAGIDTDWTNEDEDALNDAFSPPFMPDGLPLDCGGECLGEPCSPCPFSTWTACCIDGEPLDEKCCRYGD